MMHDIIKITSFSPEIADVNISCHRLLRSIPGKRFVYEAMIDDKNAIAKIFISSLRGKLQCDKEVAGITKLHDAGLKTPKILFAGQTSKKESVLVTERIMNSQDVFTFLENESDKIKSTKLFLQVVSVLSQLHVAGILQQDLHLGNFLTDGNSIYALDCAEMKFTNEPISRKQSIKQLSTLYASTSQKIIIMG